MKICDLLERTNPIAVSSTANDYVDDVLYGDYDQLASSRSLTELLAKINRAGSQYNIEFTSKTPDPKEFDPNLFSAKMNKMGLVGGAAYKDGRIRIFVNDLFLMSLKDEEVKDRLFDNIRAVVAHELTHREQGLRSKQKMFVEPKSYPKAAGPHAAYLADPQEIMANAQQIITQLRDQNVNDQTIIQSLKYNDPRLLDRSQKLADIVKQFKDSDYYKVLPRVKKTIVQLLSSNK